MFSSRSNIIFFLASIILVAASSLSIRLRVLRPVDDDFNIIRSTRLIDNPAIRVDCDYLYEFYGTFL